MLIIARDVSDLKVFTLAEVYDLNTLDEGQDFYGFLSEDFFLDGICCVWEEKGRYVSALRLQPWRDGWLLDGLQTHADHRGRGYAKQLIAESLEALKLEKVYSHIRRDNAPSIAAHISCGFRKLHDHATYLDGSVHCHSDTYLYENPRCT
jgi:GNAT superfamily N-acetyltransferase